MILNCLPWKQRSILSLLGLHPSTAFWTLLLTMRATPFLPSLEDFFKIFFARQIYWQYELHTQSCVTLQPTVCSLPGPSVNCLSFLLLEKVFLSPSLLKVEVKRTSLVAQMVKRLPTIQETWVRSLGREDPLEKAMAPHSSTLAWKIPMDDGGVW